MYRKSVLSALLALIFLAFFGTLVLSARMFPQNYDWRYRVISNLLSPRDNPEHFWLPACGIIVAAALMLPFAGYLRRNLEIASPRAARVSAGAFIAGIVALICACLVVPQHVHDVFGIRRLHELHRAFGRGIHRHRHVKCLLVRVERVQEKPAPSTLVLDLVFTDAATAGRDFP